MKIITYLALIYFAFSEVIFPQALAFATVYGGYEAVYFTAPNTGWVVGTQGTILRTTNGGVTSVDDNFRYPWK